MNFRFLILLPFFLPALTKAAEPRLIAEIEFDDTPLSLTLDFIRQKSSELSPNGRSLNILLDPKVDGETPITLSLRNVPLSAALGYVLEIASVDYRVQDSVIYLRPRDPEAGPKKRKANAVLINKARAMQVASVEFDDTPLSDVISFLAGRSAELDGAGQGINFVLAAGVDPETPITLRLQQVPLATVVGYVSDLAGTKIQADKWAIVFQPIPVEKPEPETPAAAVGGTPLPPSPF